jgi:hypothetical protein
MNKGWKEKIISLRLEGKTYKQIHEILGCEKSVISYHCSKLEGNEQLSNDGYKRLIETKQSDENRLLESAKRRSWSNENLINAVTTSKSWSEVCSKIQTKNYEGPKYIAKLLNLDTSHLSQYSSKYNFDLGLIEKAVSESSSFSEVKRKLNLPEHPLRRFIKSNNIDTSHFNYGKYNIKNTRFDQEKFVQIVQESKSVSEVMKKLGYQNLGGGNHRSIKRLIDSLELDINHFTGAVWNRSKFKPFGELKTLYSIKKFLIGERGYSCETCQISSWKDKPLSLDLHHIDGDHTNNRKENLQLLCPNCHSQTDNYRNKKKGSTGVTNMLKD